MTVNQDGPIRVAGGRSIAGGPGGKRGPRTRLEAGASCLAVPSPHMLAPVSSAERLILFDPQARNWAYVDIEWLVKIKTDSAGDVHYEAWSQPHGERTVLTKPKILCVPIEWLRVEVQ